MQLRDPETRRTLRVQHVDDPQGTALEAWQQLSRELGGALGAYREVRLEQVEGPGRDAAELEFTYTDGPSGADLHVLDRRLVAADGTEAIALYWQVSEGGFAASLEQFEQIARTFRFAA